MPNPSGRYFARLLTFGVGLWPDGENTPFENVNKICADVITQELKTAQNTLSWWVLDSLDDNNIITAVAAIISTFNKPIDEIMYLVAIPVEAMPEKIVFKNSPENARVAIVDFKSNHFDSVDMNYNSIGIVAEIIARGTSGIDDTIKIIPVCTKNAVKLLASLSEEDGKLDATALGDKMRKLIRQQIDQPK